MSWLRLSVLILLISTTVAAQDVEKAAQAFATQDYATALRELRPAAEQGEPNAQAMLGIMIREGLGVLRDYREAAKWFRRAAEQNEPHGILALGMAYLHGQGVTQDFVEGERLIRQAVGAGLSQAEAALGEIYLNGLGRPRDYAEALEWFSKSAEQGDPTGQDGLGMLYRDGKGVARDPVEAHKWFNLAAAQRPKPDIVHQTQYLRRELGATLTREQLLGAQQRAREWLAKHDPDAIETALKDLLPQARAGDASMQLEVCERFFEGRPVPQDFVSAFQWCEKAAAQDNAKSQTYVGLMWSRGLGTPSGPDQSKAAEWYAKAAEQGEATAQGNLGLLYQYGFGVAQDFVVAHMWLNLGAVQDDLFDLTFRATLPNGQRFYRNELAKKMSGEQLKDAQRRAIEWYAAHKSVARSKTATEVLPQAEAGEPSAQSRLGTMYLEGAGVPQSFVEAMTWYRRASAGGSAESETRIGILYEFGYGVDKDDKTALRWYQAAADHGDSEAQYVLGVWHDSGRNLPKNETLAAAWILKAAEGGLLNAAADISSLYIRGLGVVQDDLRAYVWCTGVMMRGASTPVFDRAKSNCAYLRPRLTASQIAEGDRLAEEWKSKHPKPWQEFHYPSFAR